MRSSFRLLRIVFVCLGLILPWTISLSAQTETATLSGHVFDPSNLDVGGAVVKLIDIDRGTITTTQTNHLGLYTFPNVWPGRYRMEVSAPGFRTVNLTNLTANTQDHLDQNFTLAVGSAVESVTVNAASTPVDLSGTVSTIVDQTLVKELPLNGRSFQTLFQLTPGVVITQAGNDSPGQFSVNGQRANANYFMVDGASANVAATPGITPGETAGGSIPSFSASGGTNSLVSIDAVQEFAIQTSSYAPEFGRTAGAQVSIVTRSGTNELHGDLFNYLRNDIFDANDWFANHDGLKKAALRQNDFGGVVGGPIMKNKTFFFFSYEGLRLRQPTTGQSEVPSLAARQMAPTSIQPFLNAFVLPTGPDELSACDPASDSTCPPSGQKANGLAPANYAFSNPSTLDAASIRIDHHFNQSLLVFGRYNYAPSDLKFRGGNNGFSLNTITHAPYALHTLTLGVTALITPRFSNDTRFNWSRSTAAGEWIADDFQGAVVPSFDSALPAQFPAKDSLFQFFPSLSPFGLNSDLASGLNNKTTQRQLNLVDGLSSQIRSHLLKMGFDYRRLSPRSDPEKYSEAVALNVATSDATAIGVVSQLSAVHATYTSYSAYAQDTWRPVGRLNITYGVRWDYNPAPNGRGSNGFAPFAIQGISDPSTVSLAAPGTAIYHATYNNFAPRLGVAYALSNSQGRETVIRAGAGIFYDLGNGPTGDVFSPFFFPFVGVKEITDGSPFPFQSSQLQPPGFGPAFPPYNELVAFPSTLRLPYTYQWNLSVEQSLGRSQTLTLGYIGAGGHSLLRQEIFRGGSAGLSPNFDLIEYIANDGFSKYNALQAQFRRRSSRNLDVLASYTLSHSLDNSSSDAQTSVPGQFLSPRSEYGPSDFDIRHTLTFGVDYNLPTPVSSTIARRLLGRWSLGAFITARSSSPVNVVIHRDIGFGSYSLRPDLVPGAALYVHDSTLPGGKKINPAAFSVPSDNIQGNLERNFFRGFGVFQPDIAIRRRFPITERIALLARLDAFNVFNHPNFAPPNSSLCFVTSSGGCTTQGGFGGSPSMLNQGLQGAGLGSGFNPLYQIGGPRSLQLSLKVEF